MGLSGGKSPGIQKQGSHHVFLPCPLTPSLWSNIFPLLAAPSSVLARVSVKGLLGAGEYRARPEQEYFLWLLKESRAEYY